MKIAFLSVLVLFAGCAPLSMTLFGVGASTGVTHAMNGVVSRTFASSAPKVRVATVLALRRMEIRQDSSDRDENNEIIRASAGERSIELTLEKISASTTRMTVTVKISAVQYDNATATEIILQTGKQLEAIEAQRKNALTEPPSH